MERLDYLISELLKEDERFKNEKIPEEVEKKKRFYRAIRNIRKPLPISEEYLKVQDEYLKDEIKNKGIIDEKDIRFDEDVISIWKGDITTINCDAIVNACNGYLLGCFIPNHNCIDNVIHSYAGMQLRRECNDIMKGNILENGNVVLTKGYNLPCKFIIQTVGPQINKIVSDKDREELKNCYLNSLKLAKENNIKSIAFPCISTGVFSFPKEEAANIAIKTVKDFIKNNKCFEHIIFNVFTNKDEEIYRNTIKEIN